MRALGYVLVGLLMTSTGIYASDELGYTDPVGGVPWQPPVRIDFNQLEKEAANEAKEASLSSRERCLKRSGTQVAGEKLMCATKTTLHDALLRAGAVAIPHSGQKDVLAYDVRRLWSGSAYASVGFTGQRFAVLDIAYPPLPSWFDQLYAQLVKQYGQPKRIEGNPQSAKGVMWARGDSIQIWLHQPQPNVLLVSYVRPDMYQYWTRPRITGK